MLFISKIKYLTYAIVGFLLNNDFWGDIIMASNKDNDIGDDCMYDTVLEPKKLTCTSSIRNIARKAINEKGLSEKEIIKTLGSKRYEK
jgi:hypothetical protein